MPGGMTWGAWLAGKALPLAICTLLALTVGQDVCDDAAQLARQGMTTYAGLELVRRCLTLFFVLLIAASYLTRGRAVAAAHGFGERMFPFLVLMAGPIGIVFLGRHSAPESLGFSAVGLVLAIAGAGISLWSLWHLRASFSIMAEARSPVTSGPYRHVRHPLYLGEALMMLGLCLMTGTLAAGFFWAALNAMQVARARIEEAKLSRQFPEYRAYQERTRFLIPGFY